MQGGGCQRHGSAELLGGMGMPQGVCRLPHHLGSSGSQQTQVAAGQDRPGHWRAMMHTVQPRAESHFLWAAAGTSANSSYPLATEQLLGTRRRAVQRHGLQNTGASSTPRRLAWLQSPECAHSHTHVHEQCPPPGGGGFVLGNISHGALLSTTAALTKAPGRGTESSPHFPPAQISDSARVAEPALSCPEAAQSPGD